MKKIISTVLFFSFTATIFIIPFFVQQKKADALLDGGGSLGLLIKETVADATTTLIQSRALDKIVQDTLNWAAGGFDGEPGFINNWDDMLKGLSHEVVAGAFDFASGKALESISLNSGVNQEAQRGCQYDTSIRHAQEQRTYTDNGLSVPQNVLQRQAQEMESCSQIGGNNSSLNNEAIENCKKDAENRYSGDMAALEGFYGPNFFTDPKASAELQQVENLYSSSAEDCEKIGMGSSFVSNIAQSNYNLWQSGETITVRSIARTIANQGANSLNIDPLTSLIEGEGNTLKRLLGSQQNVDQFYTDIGVGGWAGYIALADPHNYPSGLQSLVTSALSEKTVNKISKTVEDIQTPNKFLPAVDCGDAGKDANGKCLGKAIITTLSTTKDAETSDSTKKAKDKTLIGRELSDIVAMALQKIGETLLQKGFSAISKSGGSGGGGNQQSANNSFANVYQNDYDILGLSNNEDVVTIGGDTNNQQGGNTTSGNSTNTLNENDGNFQTDLYDASAPFIGGPEDEEGSDWTNVPELIINFKEVLEPAIVNTERELQLYNEMKLALKSSQNDIIKIDRCVPGPDYNWEQRFNDLFDTTSNNDEAKENKIAFNEMKKMSTDSRVNIPGAERMRSAVLNILSKGNDQYNEISDFTSKKESLLLTLKDIRDSIQADFDIYKQNIHPKLPLFESQWYKLTRSEKIEIISLDPPLERGSYLILKNGETPESILDRNEPKVMNAILEQSWDIWRSEKGKELPSGTKPSGAKQKTNLRYKYYTIQNDISRQADILRAEVERDNIINNNKTTKDFLSDCIQLKSFVTGYPTSQIENSLTNPFVIQKGIQIPTLDLVTIKKKHGRETKFLKLKATKSDSQIRTYLETERQKQSRKESSVFKTDIITGERSIERSMLGFTSSSELSQYINTSYSQDDFPDLEITAHAKSISEIFEKDYGLANYQFNGNGTGFLYCRLTTSFDSIKDKSKDLLTSCVKDWYHTSDLDYEVIFSGI